MKKYVVTLTAEERQSLQEFIAAGKAAARKLTHARILLSGSASWNWVWKPPWPVRSKTTPAARASSMAGPRPV